jgi:hypothetical protein
MNTGAGEKGGMGPSGVVDESGHPVALTVLLSLD